MSVYIFFSEMMSITLINGTFFLLLFYSRDLEIKYFFPLFSLLRARQTFCFVGYEILF